MIRPMCPNCQSDEVEWNSLVLSYECQLCGTLWNFRDQFLALPQDDEGGSVGRGKQLFPVFVYGTLMEGEHYHKYLKDCEKVGNGMVPGIMYWARAAAFPGAIFQAGPGRVYGEVYNVTKEVRDKLDELEGYDKEDVERSMYVRRPVAVSLETGMTIDAEAYEYRGKLWPALLIVGGDFREAKKRAARLSK